MDPPRNRKQRRAAAASQTSSFDPSSIPMAHPPRSPNRGTKGKTLVEIISERQGERLTTVDASELDVSSLEMLRSAHATTNTDTGKEQQTQNHDDESSDTPIPPLIDTIMLAAPLTTLHVTLAYLAAHQYAETIQLGSLIRESIFVAFPILTLMIHLAHGHVVSLPGPSVFPWREDKRSRLSLFPPSLRTMTFLPLAVLLGVKLITITNEEPYYAVMKRAPAIGTLWVWSILEIPVGAAVLGALGPLIWGVWWKGYGIV